MNKLTQFALWLGVVKIGRKSPVCSYDQSTGQLTYIHPEQVIFPIHFAPLHLWKRPFLTARCYGWFYVFRNLPGVIKWQENRLLPRRWGFGIMGLVEFGDRG